MAELKPCPFCGGEFFTTGVYDHHQHMAQTIILATDNNVGCKWISVKNRLPDKHGKPYVCLLTFPHGGQFPYILNWYEYGDNGYVNGRHFQDEGVDGMKVTHWMPLPPAPKGE